MIKQLNRGPKISPHGHSLWAFVGRRLKTRRTQLGLSIDDVADELAIPSRVYESYETGEAQTPALLLNQMANLFGVPLMWFFQDFDAEEDREIAADNDLERTFTVATPEERAKALTDCFNGLDFEGQQQLLAIAKALSRS